MDGGKQVSVQMKCISKIQKTEMMEDENEANLRNFLQWATELGISDSSASNLSCLGHTLSVANFPEAGGRGLAAVRGLRKGELVLRVPKAVLMTSDCLISRDHNFSVVLGKYNFLSSTQLLSVALLNEVNKGRSSWWYPYLKQLPQSYDLIESFSPFEIEALQIDDAIWTAEKAVKKCRLEWEEAKPLMSELNLKPQLITFRTWLWVSATISSRTMHIPWDSAGCLCPVGDFFNYAPPEEDSCHLESSMKKLFGDNADRLTDAGYDETVASYCFYAKRNYIEGDQVLLSYGTYTNLELLEHYGFVLQENPNDKAFISLEPEMYSLCSWPKETLYISQNGKPSFALLSTLRLWAIPLSKRRSVGHLAYSGDKISSENEIVVMEWIAKKCCELLSNFLTSTDEDMLLLHTVYKIQDCNHLSVDYGELSPIVNREICVFLENINVMSGKLCSNSHISAKRRSIDRWKVAVQWRRGYKSILSHCIKRCKEALDIPL